LHHSDPLRQTHLHPTRVPAAPASAIAPSRWHDRWLPKVLLVVAPSVIALAAAPLNADPAWILTAARRVLDGARLYVDIIETNPPLIFWMMTIPALIADARLVGVFVGMFLTASVLVSLRVLARPPAPARLSRDALIVSFLIAVVVPGVPWTGQREQIAAILLLPYALLAAHAASGAAAPRSLAVTCGALAGVGLALKPFFLAPWAAVELVVWMRRRTLRTFARPESVTVLLIQIVYVVLVLVFTPEYVTRVARLVQATYNVGYAVDKSLIAQTGRFRKLTLLGLATVATIAWRRRPSSAFTQVFGAATLGWLVSYIVQGKAYLLWSANSSIPSSAIFIVCHRVR
jgi:hypothetical protein